MKERGVVLAVLFLVAGLFAKPQENPATDAKAPPAASGGTGEAMAWDRDFDLLLELKKEPTKAQREITSKRADLEQERLNLLEQLDDLRARMAAVEGSYTSEAILGEMLRQGVADMTTAQENLRVWIKRDEAQVKDLDTRMKQLSAQGGE